MNIVDMADRLACIIFPNRCCGCGAVIYPEEELCVACRAVRAHFSYGRGCCKVCGQPNRQCICGGRHFFGKAVFAFFYEGSVKRSIRSFKFKGRLFYGKLFARQMLHAAQESGITDNATLVVPVPMHPVKKLKRGFNQTELLASEFAKMSGIKYINALEKLTYSGAQHDLKASERIGNVVGTFEVKKKYEDEINGARIILVDDIMTTHATLNEAAKTLLIFGADNVDALTAAATRKNGARGIFDGSPSDGNVKASNKKQR